MAGAMSFLFSFNKLNSENKKGCSLFPTPYTTVISLYIDGKAVIKPPHKVF